VPYVGRRRQSISSCRADTVDQQAVFEWASLNTDAVLVYCEGRIDTIELGQLMKRLP
jgi:hypothetical protein